MHDQQLNNSQVQRTCVFKIRDSTKICRFTQTLCVLWLRYTGLMTIVSVCVCARTPFTIPAASGLCRVHHGNIDQSETNEQQWRHALHHAKTLAQRSGCTSGVLKSGLQRFLVMQAVLASVEDLWQSVRWLCNMAAALWSTATESLSERCTICFEDVSRFRIQTVGICNHRFCASCMRRHCVSKLGERAFPVPCPHPGCRTGMLRAECNMFLNASKDLHLLNKVSCCYWHSLCHVCLTHD